MTRAAYERKSLPSAPTAAGARLAARKADYGVEDRLLAIDAVIEIAGLSRSMIYRKVRQGTFPKPYKPGGAATRWSEREVVRGKRRSWRGRREGSLSQQSPLAAQREFCHHLLAGGTE